MRRGLWVLSVLVATGIANAGPLLEYEGFNYAPGSSLNSQNGGSGWSGAWGTPGGLDATIAAASLTFGTLPVASGSVSTAGSQPPNQGSSVATWIRNLGTSAGADNTTTYFSFLLRPDAGFGFYGGVNLGGVFVGVSGNQSFYGLEGPANDLSLSAVPVVAGQTVLLVLRADFHAGNDALTLYVNPTPGGPEPGVASVVKSDLDVGAVTSLTINNYGGFTTDEIRIGSSFADVAPAAAAAPEPGYGLMVALAGGAFFGANQRTRRRRRS
jgi:hypothetical protein